MYVNIYLDIYLYIYIHVCPSIHTHTHIYISDREKGVFALGGVKPKESAGPRTATPHVEYAERGQEYGILFIFSLFCKYIHHEYVRIPVRYRVHQAVYVIHILVAASQEYVNADSTRRTATPPAAAPVRRGTRGAAGRRVRRPQGLYIYIYVCVCVYLCIYISIYIHI